MNINILKLHSAMHYCQECLYIFMLLRMMSSYFRFQAIVGSLIVTTLLFCDAGTKSRPHPHKGVRLLFFWLILDWANDEQIFRLASCRFSNHSPVIILHTIYLQTKTKNWKQENRYPIFINNIVNLWISESTFLVGRSSSISEMESLVEQLYFKILMLPQISVWIEFEI